MRFSFSPSNLFRGSRPDWHGTPSIPLVTIAVVAGRELSAGTTLCQQTRREIDDGRYECRVCHEAVSRRRNIWHCDSCRGICHYECIVDWSAPGNRGDQGEVPGAAFEHEWKCPSCQAEYGGRPVQTCWCKMVLCTTDNGRGRPFNSCGERCSATLPCEHICNEICHPGPCEECQICIPKPVSSRRLNFPRDSLELVRWAPPAPRLNEQDNEQGFTAKGRARDNARPRTLRAGIWVPLVICLAVTVSLAVAIFGLTKVVVEPYNYRSIAENNDAMRAAWILLAVGAIISIGMNMKSLTRMRDFVDYCMLRISCTSFAATWTSWMGICGEVQFLWELAKFLAFYTFSFMMVVWVVGAFACTIMVPLLARKAEFARACDGFDTRILLDIRNKVRRNPVFIDLHPEPFQPPYSMAIIDRSTPSLLRTSFELNYFELSYRKTFGIPSDIRQTVGPRKTIYTNTATNRTYIRTQSQLVSDPHLATKIAATQDVEYDDDFIPSADDVVEESPGSYRVLYDWTDNFWNTKIGRQTHTDGNFISVGKHLILPSLGLRIPNFADFEASCKLEPFLKVHRSSADRAYIKDTFGMNLTQMESLIGETKAALDRLGRERYRDDVHGTVILRTVAPGVIQDALEVCAQRRDVVKDGKVVLEGLGESLPVVVGLLASTRYSGWEAEKRGSCKGVWL